MTLMENPKKQLLDLRDVLPELTDVLNAKFGMARGTNTAGDVLTQTIDGRDLNDIWNEFQQTVQLNNQERAGIVSFLTFGVTQPIEQVPVIGGDDFEEATEFGEPKGIHGGDYREFGYDFKYYDIAIRYTWQFLADATAAQVEALNNMALEADSRLVFNKVLKAIFSNVDRTADIRNRTGINVYPFYNGDGSIPPKYKNYEFDGTESHYMVSGGAVVDPGDLDDMETKLTTKGYGSITGSTLVLMANRAQVAIMRNFRVANGASYDFIPAQGQAPFLLPANVGGIGGGQPAASYQGFPVAGQYGPWTIITEDYVPSGYLFGFATGGQNQAANPVGFREHQNAALRGLRLVKGRDTDYPLVDSFYNRGFGTGVRQRGAGVVMQIKASGSYTVPTAFA